MALDDRVPCAAGEFCPNLTGMHSGNMLRLSLCAYDSRARETVFVNPSRRKCCKSTTIWRCPMVVLLAIVSLADAGFAQSGHPVPVSPPIIPLSAKEIVSRAMKRDLHNWEMEKNYTFVERVEQRELNPDGGLKSEKSETEEVIFLYSQAYTHLIQRNDKPLSQDEARKVEKKLNDTMDKRGHETAAERQERLVDFDKRHQQEHAFLLEVPEAYDFRIVREETLNGRPAFVISGEPRESFRPNLNAARVLPKLRPTLWIDKNDYECLKMAADVIDTIVWGGFLLRLHPGSHIELEQTLVNNEVWLPLHAHISLDARIALFKTMRLDVDVRFSEYRKFRSDAKIISVEEVKH